jgi:tetratricopeptide (TPR) repeat protein
MENDFLHEATELIGRKQWQEAKSVLTEALAKKPAGWTPVQESELGQEVYSWNRDEFIAYCGWAGESGQGRITWFRRSYSQACCLLAYVAVELGNPQDAFEALRTGLEMEPDHPLLWCELGHLFQLLKRHDDALGCYRRAESARAWATNIQKAASLRGQGINLIDLGRLEDAEEALRRSLEFEPESASALHELGYIQHLREKAEPS